MPALETLSYYDHEAINEAPTGDELHELPFYDVMKLIDRKHNRKGNQQ